MFFSEYKNYISELEMTNNSKFINGLIIYPQPVILSEEITICYSGLLYLTGSSEVYLHYGYGDLENWVNVKELKMRKTDHGFTLKMRPTHPTNLNLCFRDNENNWDNNSGLNWSFEIENV